MAETENNPATNNKEELPELSKLSLEPNLPAAKTGGKGNADANTASAALQSYQNAAANNAPTNNQSLTSGSQRPKDNVEEDSSEISASDDGSWIAWFCSLRGNEFFCEVDEDYIQDDFNLTGLHLLVPYYDYALDMVLDVEMPMEEKLTEAQQEIVESAAVSVLLCLDKSSNIIYLIFSFQSLGNALRAHSRTLHSDKSRYACYV